MSFIESIQSFLPRPENRSRDEIARDLDDEFAFHLEMKAHHLMGEAPGLGRDEARVAARGMFGDVEAIKRQCQRIALRERIMLQRVNLVLMVVVTLLVIGVGAQVMITQRYNTLALQAITTDLSRMKFEAEGAARGVADAQSSSGTAGGMVFVDGAVARMGVYALPAEGTLTISRLLTAVGGLDGEGEGARVHIKRRDGDAWREFNYALADEGIGDFALHGDDQISFSISGRVMSSESLVGKWRQINGDGTAPRYPFLLEIISCADIRNNTPTTAGRLSTQGQPGWTDLSFRNRDAAENLSATVQHERHGTLNYGGRWQMDGDRLLLNLSEVFKELVEPIIMIREGGAPAEAAADARTHAVGDFVVRLFALADPNDPDLDQIVREFLDNEEKAIDQRHADDPATAGMIKELIAARRKIFESDEAIQRAATAEEKTRAVSDFLQDVLTSADSTAPTIRVSEVLDSASKTIQEEFADNPELQAKLRERIAEAQKNLQAGGGGAPDADKPAPATRDNDDEFPELSPFIAVQWKDYTPFVNINGTWGELVSIDDVAAAEIIDFCRKTYGERDRKRFTEDLVQVMAEMGRPLQGGAAVKLRIKEFVTGTLMSIERAPMTEENRRFLWEANNAASGNDPGYPMWLGQPSGPDPRQQSRGEQPAPDEPPRPANLTREQALADVASLETALRERFSYLHLRDVDLEQALADLRSELAEGMGVGDFAFELQKFIARFGDGHAGVGGLRDFTPPAYAPFQMRAAHDNRIVAFSSDSSSLLDPSHPYLVSINDIPIERLLEAAKRYVADGSPALVRRRTIDIAHRLGLLARESELAGLGPAPGEDTWPDVVVELASATPADGTVKVSLGPAQKSPLYMFLSDRSSGLIADGQIGYIRLAEMTEESARMACWLMPQFKNTRGLIIDVRGNGGGSRDALLTLLPHVLAPDAPPRVLNIAAYRLADGFDADHLESRFMYRRDDAHWSDAERAAIEAAMTKFKPTWLPPAGLKDHFSDWHYLVVSRADAVQTNPDLYHYDKPVIVLLDGECFSATDIFLGAFKGLSNVTLLGTASSGGSGRKQSVRLPNSGLNVSLSSMISYLPGGAMFDLQGVEPDVVVEPIPTDFISVYGGGTDSQLQAAIDRVLK